MATRIFLCDEREEPEIRQFIREAAASFAKGEEYIVTWSCANVTSIQVGDRALVKRIGRQPHGFFAAGYVVAAEKRYQLRLRDRRYQNLSEAYDNEFFRGNFTIWLAWEACTDYDTPLRTARLEEMPEFRGALFNPTVGGGAFRAEFVDLLEEEWEDHCEAAVKQKRAFRLVDFFIAHGQKANQQGKPAEAVEWYGQAIDIDPNCAKAFVGSANALQALGEHPRAIADYTEALDIGSAYDKVAFYRRGVSHAALKDWAAAARDFGRAAALDPRNPEALTQQAIALYKTRDFAKAIAALTEVVNRDPENTEALLYLGRSHYNRKEYEAALARMEALLDVAPDSAEGFYYRGVILTKLIPPREQEALLDLKKAARLFKNQNQLDRYVKARNLMDVLATEEGEDEVLRLPQAETPVLTPPAPAPMVEESPKEEGREEAAEEERRPDRLREAEKRALELVLEQYNQEGWEIAPAPSRKAGYKFRALRGEVEEDVEVKGLVSSDLTFAMSSREVRQAEANPNFVLWAIANALSEPEPQCWRGREILEKFALDPMKYLARYQGELPQT
ncbi:MAG: tetratricopeptide repeat protein [Oscillatoriales cyanobacterium SM2_1_8]|nr:tetratricopeptide repeat protein [Oscillatoriales cyanobacterium SM2_1_8]